MPRGLRSRSWKPSRKLASGRSRWWRRYPTEDLERVHSPIMSPLVWDLGHIAAYEDLWLAHRLRRRGRCCAPTSPRSTTRSRRPARCAATSSSCAARGARRTSSEVRARDARGDRRARRRRRRHLHEMVLRHELQHTETMLQTMALAGLLATTSCRRRRSPRLAGAGAAGLELVEIAGGRVRDGRRRRRLRLRQRAPAPRRRGARVRIARRPSRNATWLTFGEGGGYERREWWSDEGWAWKEEYDISHHAGPGRRGAGRSATRPSATSPGSRPTPSPARTARGCRPRPSGRRRRPGTPSRSSTASARCGSGPPAHFGGYPGFVAHPYREYSEVFFGDRLPRPARRLVGDRTARRHPDVPQLGPARAPPDLRRRAAREGR